jgi:hypothetical protein
MVGRVIAFRNRLWSEVSQPALTFYDGNVEAGCLLLTYSLDGIDNLLLWIKTIKTDQNSHPRNKWKLTLTDNPSCNFLDDSAPPIPRPSLTNPEHSQGVVKELG